MARVAPGRRGQGGREARRGRAARRAARFHRARGRAGAPAARHRRRRPGPGPAAGSARAGRRGARRRSPGRRRRASGSRRPQSAGAGCPPRRSRVRRTVRRGVLADVGRQVGHAREGGARFLAARDLDAKFLLDRHDQLERVDRIQAEARADERGVVRDGRGIDVLELEGRDDELLDRPGCEPSRP